MSGYSHSGITISNPNLSSALKNNVESNFDWVNARFECSLAQVFKELELGARADTEKMKTLEPGKTFEVSASSNYFSVSNLTGRKDDYPSVLFQLRGDLIRVTQNDKPVLEAGVTLDNSGQCKLKIKSTGDELDQWQVRRMALERLFF